jgi:hypothetical protein
MSRDLGSGVSSPQGRSIPQSVPAAREALAPATVDVELKDFEIRSGRLTCSRLDGSARNASTTHSTLREAFESTISDIEKRISAAQHPDAVAVLTNGQELKSALEAEIETERNIEKQLEVLFALVGHVEGSVLKHLQERYQSATGLLDGHSRLAELTWGLSALASFGLAAGLAVTYEHAIFHGVSHFVHQVLGYSVLSYAASGATQLGVLVAQGIACFAGALAGPSLLGLIKTAGGRCVRAISPTHREAFAALALESSKELSNYRHLTLHIAERMSELQPRLSSFYARNEDVRALISATLERLSQNPDTFTVGDCNELHERSSALGASELITLMRFLSLEKKLRELTRVDFRSPELIEATSPQSHDAARVWGLGRGLRLSVKSLASLFHSATTIGERSAIGASRNARNTFENLPQNAVTDVVSGLGSGVSTTIEQALRAGTQPVKTTYSFVKGILGFSKTILVGGQQEGPRLETFLRVMFDLPELEKGNRTRFFAKLLPSLIRAATQKPIVMEQAEQVEELAGNVSPKGIETKLAEKEGSYAVGKKMMKDLTALAYGTTQETVVRYGYVFPLWLLKSSAIIRGTAPGLSNWAAERLELHDEARLQKLQKKMDRELQNLSNASTLRELQDNELDVHVIEKFVEYSYRPTTTISQKEMSALLHYWELRRKASWHEAADTARKHGIDLTEIHPKFRSLRKILDVKSNLFSSVTRGLLFGKNIDSDEQLTPEEILVARFTAWATPLDGLAQPSRATILDASPDGMHVALVEPNGSLKLLKAGEVRALYARSSEGADLHILPHADHARVTACEMVLSMKLEPYQRKKLIETHYDLMAGDLAPTEACERLVRVRMPREQILSADGRGIIDRGLIGPSRSAL